MSESLVPKVGGAGYVVDEAGILGWCEVVKTIKMLAQANRPPRVHVLLRLQMVGCYRF